MKRKKGLIIALAVLVVMLGVYLGLRAWNTARDEEEQERQEAAIVRVTDTDPENITAITFNVGNGDMDFEKDGDSWYYTADPDFPLDQSCPEEMAETVGQIEADRELTDGDELTDYGLDEPAYTVEYTDSEGNVTRIYFGDMTGDYYYVTVNDDGIVYTVASTVIENLDYSLEDIAELDDYPSIGSGNLVREVITQNGETTTYDSENEDQSEDIAAVAGGLGAATLSDVADYSVADEDLESFGLDDTSRITVEATYTEDEEEKLLTLYIGQDDGEGSRYVMINDSRIVYLLSEEICNNILNVEDEESTETDAAE